MASASSGSIARFVVQRILLFIPMVLIIATFVFLMLRVSPADPVSATVGGKLSEDALQQRRDALGLDEPLIVQYGQFLKDIVTLNFGQTITDNRAVIDIVKDNGGATLTLATAGFAIAL